MNPDEQAVSNALTAHFGQRVLVEFKRDELGLPYYKVNDKLSYGVTSYFHLNFIPLGRTQYLFRLD